MFQNINEYTVQEDKKKPLHNSRWSEVLEKGNVVIYILSFMLSLVGVGGDFSLFSISILGACFSSSVPLFGVVIASLLGNAIRFGTDGLLEYFLTFLLLILSIFIIKPKYNEDERNEKIKVGINIFISTMIIQLVKGFLSTFTFYDLLLSITMRNNCGCILQNIY